MQIPTPLKMIALITCTLFTFTTIANAAPMIDGKNPFAVDGTTDLAPQALSQVLARPGKPADSLPPLQEGEPLTVNSEEKSGVDSREVIARNYVESKTFLEIQELLKAAIEVEDEDLIQTLELALQMATEETGQESAEQLSNSELRTPHSELASLADLAPFGLAPTVGAIADMLVRKVLRIGVSQDDTALLEMYEADGLVIEDGTRVIAPQAYESVARRWRVVTHEEVEALMQIRERSHAHEYARVANMVLANKELCDLFPDQGRQTGWLRVNHIIASVFDMRVAVGKGVRLTKREESILTLAAPIIRRNRGTFFDETFFNAEKRLAAIEKARAAGFEFEVAAQDWQTRGVAESNAPTVEEYLNFQETGIYETDEERKDRERNERLEIERKEQLEVEREANEKETGIRETNAQREDREYKQALEKERLVNEEETGIRETHAERRTREIDAQCAPILTYRKVLNWTLSIVGAAGAVTLFFTVGLPAAIITVVSTSVVVLVHNGIVGKMYQDAKRAATKQYDERKVVKSQEPRGKGQGTERSENVVVKSKQQRKTRPQFPIHVAMMKKLPLGFVPTVAAIADMVVQGVVRVAQSQRDAALLEKYSAKALVLQDGTRLISEEMDKTDIDRVRAVVHEEVEAVMQILHEGTDAAVYKKVSDALMNDDALWNVVVASRSQAEIDRFTKNPSLFVNHVVALAFEYLAARQLGVVLTDGEKDIVSRVSVALKRRAHRFFDERFWDAEKRASLIESAVDAGFEFEVAGDYLKSQGHEEKLSNDAIEAGFGSDEEGFIEWIYSIPPGEREEALRKKKAENLKSNHQDDSLIEIRASEKRAEVAYPVADLNAAEKTFEEWMFEMTEQYPAVKWVPVHLNATLRRLGMYADGDTHLSPHVTAHRLIFEGSLFHEQVHHELKPLGLSAAEEDVVAGTIEMRHIMRRSYEMDDEAALPLGTTLDKVVEVLKQEGAVMFQPLKRFLNQFSHDGRSTITRQVTVATQFSQMRHDGEAQIEISDLEFCNRITDIEEKFFGVSVDDALASYNERVLAASVGSLNVREKSSRSMSRVVILDGVSELDQDVVAHVLKNQHHELYVVNRDEGVKTLMRVSVDRGVVSLSTNDMYEVKDLDEAVNVFRVDDKVVSVVSDNHGEMVRITDDSALLFSTRRVKKSAFKEVPFEMMMLPFAFSYDRATLEEQSGVNKLFVKSGKLFQVNLDYVINFGEDMGAAFAHVMKVLGEAMHVAIAQRSIKIAA